MAIRGHFTLPVRKESIDKFAASFRDPALIRIVQVADDFRISAPKHFHANSHFWISEKLQQKRVLLRTKSGRILSVALESPTKFQVVFRHTVGPPATLKEIFKHTQCSDDVTVFMSDNPNLLLSNRHDLGDPVAYGELKILSTVEETCLLGHALSGLTLESDATFLSVRAPIFVEIVNGYKSKSPGEFRQWVDSLGQQVATLRVKMKAPEHSSTNPDIVLLAARIGDSVNNSEHSCFMHSVNAGVTRSNAKKRESNSTPAAISPNVIDELEPESESVDVHALKYRFEPKSNVSPSVTHAKLSSAASGCIEKSPGCPSAARLTEEKGSDFGKVVSRSQSLSLHDLLDNSESKTNTIPRSDVRELEKSAVMKRAEITQPIRKSPFFFSRSPDSKAKMTTHLRSKSQENLLDVSEKGRQAGPRAGARSSAAAQSFQEKKVTSKSTDVEVVKARNLPSAQAIASSSDDDHDSYEDADFLSSEEANSATKSSFKPFGRAKTQSDSKSAKDSKSKKPPKTPKCKRPLPRPPKEEDSNVGKFPQTPPPKETNAQERYLKISHAAAAYGDDAENQYASLRQDFDISKCVVATPSDDDVSWRGAEKEWRKMKDAAEIPRDVDVARLTVNEVGHCLRLLKMKKYVKSFKRRVVDGAVLVTLTDAMLMETFKMDQLDARKIVMFSKENWRPSKK